VRALAALVAAGRARAASPGLLDVAPVAGVAPYSASETLNALRSETPPGLPVAQAEMARPAAIEQDPAELVLRSLTETTGRSVALDDEVSEFDSLTSSNCRKKSSRLSASRSSPKAYRPFVPSATWSMPSHGWSPPARRTGAAESGMPPAPDPGGIAYLDSSAIVKLVIAEPESETLRRELADWPARARRWTRSTSRQPCGSLATSGPSSPTTFECRTRSRQPI
jgi:hypothetical protein